MDALNAYIIAAEKDSRMQAEIVEIQVPDTTTFYTSLKFQRLAHAGSTDQLDDLFLTLLAEISNKDKQWWIDDPSFTKQVLEEVFLVHDPRLFVPFCNNGTRPSYNAANFNSYNLDHARHLIMDTVKK